jgi:hypothetical protein
MRTGSMPPVVTRFTDTTGNAYCFMKSPVEPKRGLPQLSQHIHDSSLGICWVVSETKLIAHWVNARLSTRDEQSLYILPARRNGIVKVGATHRGHMITHEQTAGGTPNRVDPQPVERSARAYASQATTAAPHCCQADSNRTCNTWTHGAVKAIPDAVVADNFGGINCLNTHVSAALRLHEVSVCLCAGGSYGDNRGVGRPEPPLAESARANQTRIVR